MLDQLAAAYFELEDDEELRCGVLFARGEHFTGGLDLAEVGPLIREGRLGLSGAFARLEPDMADLFDSEDGQEGLRSFIERREARFVGR